MSAEAKAALRELVLRRRGALAEEDRASSSGRIITAVLDLPAYRLSGVVLAYASFGTELRTDGFLRRVLGDGKTLLLPRVERGGLTLYEVRDLALDLSPGTWGIREPVPERCPVAAPGNVDFALIPGVAFDGNGGRLGYGGGFYDRLLAGLTEGPPLVSAAFEVQMVDGVPVGPHDAPVHAVVTEEGIYPENGRPAGL
ncbi:MAG: 5-formyltetrahydrofolate cyclo-ligase [uncultured Rubrobacteraceae bacterium]|uniref:5-formyltetrahydrofolate cyclo-ligase n=1 Tax=uncultured Rubrobacteraceae bacterium TaxID=349277 RepID=A0A6J4QEP8_9ACTN|nr:MAG: 5-formyltetrahydrofolate cyclo-ligase [uncultured Rubrobacteraceae bacterium]